MKRTKLIQSHPELISQWHKKKNEGIDLEEIGSFSHKKVWWKCSTGKRSHIWLARVRHRSKGNGCPFCAGVKKLT